MTQDQWRSVEDLFHQAGALPVSKRASFLQKACNGDEVLHSEVQSLLGHDGRSVEIQAVVDDVAQCLSEEEAASLVGRRVGPYRLAAVIGRGGMGVVCEADRGDDQFHKRVAIKLIKRGMDTPLVITRFRQERQILAGLEHPGIARLLDGGATDDGQPYFVMELVEGLPITAYCEERRLTIAQRLELFRSVCEAVQYAHRNLVVHRDIKPSNILITPEGRPKLLDFGIAKLLGPGDSADALASTMSPMKMMTPDYASPEQVLSGRIAVGTDIYSLGAVLYEMLAGVRPHQLSDYTPGEIERVICQGEIERPSRVAATASRARKLAGDLDNIVLRALRKEPERRYSSVEQLSEDIRRYLEGRPITARPDTWVYRMGKFVRRRRLAVAAAALVLLTLAGGVVAATLQARRAEHRFEQVRRLAKTFLFDVEDQVQPLPGSTKVREMIVRTSLEYLDSLALESGGDRTLMFELASAYQKIGDVQGYGRRPNLGQLGPALESHRKALAIARQLAASDSSPRIARLLARAWHRTGFLLRSHRQTAAAVEHFRNGLVVAERLYAAHPGNPEDSPLLMEVSGHLADAEILAGDLLSAGRHWRRSLEVAQEWAARYPGDEAQSGVGAGHLRMARASMQAGDPASAARHARESIAIYEDFVRRAPANIVQRRHLLNSYEALAYASSSEAFVSLGDSRTALTYHRRALGIAAELWAADPTNMLAVSDLSISYRNVCSLLVDEDPGRAAEQCRRGIGLLAGVTVWGDHGRVLTFMDLARALQKLGRANEALEMLRKALTIQERIVTMDPDQTDERLWILRIHNLTGGVLQDMGDFAGAIGEHRQALAIAEELLRSHSSLPELRRDEADCYERLGQVHEALGKRQSSPDHWRESRYWYERSLELWDHWTDWGVSSPLSSRRREAALKAVARSEKALAATAESAAPHDGRSGIHTAAAH